MFVGVCLEIHDQFVEGVLHMHVPNFDPDFIIVRKRHFLFFKLARLVFERVSRGVGIGNQYLCSPPTDRIARLRILVIFDLEKVVTHGLIGELM